MPTLVSAGLRGRGKLRRKMNNDFKRKASVAFLPSTRTTAGCNYLGSYCSPRDPGGQVVVFACNLTPWGPLTGPRPSKIIKHGPSCTQPCTQVASTSLFTNATGNQLKRALEATGGDGRTPTSYKDLRAPKHNIGSACIRGSGLCPLTGWTIADYCPSCHG